MEIKVYLEIGKKLKITKIEKWWKTKKKWFVRLRDELTVKNHILKVSKNIFRNKIPLKTYICDLNNYLRNYQW